MAPFDLYVDTHHAQEERRDALGHQKDLAAALGGPVEAGVLGNVTKVLAKDALRTREEEKKIVGIYCVFQ